MDTRMDTTSNTGSEPRSEDGHPGDVGIFQSLGLGLMAFTVLMALMAIVLSLFVDIGA